MEGLCPYVPPTRERLNVQSWNVKRLVGWQDGEMGTIVRPQAGFAVAVPGPFSVRRLGRRSVAEGRVTNFCLSEPWRASFKFVAP